MVQLDLQIMGNLVVTMKAVALVPMSNPPIVENPLQEVDEGPVAASVRMHRRGCALTTPTGRKLKKPWVWKRGWLVICLGSKKRLLNQPQHHWKRHGGD